MVKKGLQDQINELTANWKRALADYQNLQKRHDKEKTEIVHYSTGILITKLLGTLDNFEKVQGYLPDPGLDLAIKELKRVLFEEGLEEIEVLGKEFNPQEMDALEFSESQDKETNRKGATVVTEVITKGYFLNGRIIRPAKVKVEKQK